MNAGYPILTSFHNLPKKGALQINYEICVRTANRQTQYMP